MPTIGPLRPLGDRTLPNLAVPYRPLLLVLLHAILVIASYALAFLLRFDFSIPGRYLDTFLVTFPVILGIRLLVFEMFHLYAGLWQYVSLRDLLGVIKAVTVSSGLFAATAFGLYNYGFGEGFPRSVVILDWIICIGLVGGVRLVSRQLRETRFYRKKRRERRALIVGAGDAGEILIREINHSFSLDYDIVGLVDDDPRKTMARMHGVLVQGRVSDLPELCGALKVEELLLAIPSVGGRERQRIIRACLETDLPLKTVPSLSDLARGTARVGHLQNVRPEDLLVREPVAVDIDRLLTEVSGKRVMVTGAAGSIGSELARQLATLSPELIILYERNESSLYFTDIDLRDKHPELRTVPIVGDILDQPKLKEVIDSYRPDVLYHAAAYKHVPLMEAQPLEAIQNNIFGTEMVARTAIDAAVGKFVNISTDKAVRPVGIMGMTKRIAEDLLVTLNEGPTTFVSVRFGNVLGSAGSVLPLFQMQLAQGGPITVTDPDATRYFMLIAEAAQLVLQAGAMGKGGEVFFLDMGDPIRIGELADNLVRLSGLKPGRDVGVETIGLRPGERLSEELVHEAEELLVSEHEKIFLAQSLKETKEFSEEFEELRRLLLERDHMKAVDQLNQMANRY